MTNTEKLADAFTELEKARRNDTGNVASMRDICYAAMRIDRVAFAIQLERYDTDKAFSNPLREIKPIGETVTEMLRLANDKLSHAAEII